MIAYLTILITTVNFVVSVEVNFYPKYQIYFGLFNHGGTLIDIENARDDMIETLLKELSYAFAKQFFATVVFIVGGTLLIPRLPFGFTEEMLGIYRVLCVGYAFYAYVFVFRRQCGSLIKFRGICSVQCTGNLVYDEWRFQILRIWLSDSRNHIYGDGTYEVNQLSEEAGLPCNQ